MPGPKAPYISLALPPYFNLPASPRETVRHDVVRVATGEVVGFITSDWDTDTPGIFSLDGYPVASYLRGARFSGNVPRGAFDEFCWVYSEACASVAGQYFFRPRA